MTTTTAPARLAYSPQEVAAMLGVGPESVREWIRAGHLRARKLGTRWLVSRAAIDELLAGDGHVTRSR